MRTWAYEERKRSPLSFFILIHYHFHHYHYEVFLLSILILYLLLFFFFFLSFLLLLVILLIVILYLHRDLHSTCGGLWAKMWKRESTSLEPLKLGHARQPRCRAQAWDAHLFLSFYIILMRIMRDLKVKVLLKFSKSCLIGCPKNGSKRRRRPWERVECQVFGVPEGKYKEMRSDFEAAAGEVCVMWWIL